VQHIELKQQPRPSSTQLDSGSSSHGEQLSSRAGEEAARMDTCSSLAAV
jgi:hypothetical protein